ncbi:MAG: hypothetical protein ACI4ST_03950, partial [Candidatus Gallimonas sp.]
MGYSKFQIQYAVKSMIAFLLAFAVALMTFAASMGNSGIVHAETRAKNVLLIQTDHEFFYQYGTENDPGVIRENYSEFCESAVNFVNAKSVCPLCSPARR